MPKKNASLPNLRECMLRSAHFQLHKHSLTFSIKTSLDYIYATPSRHELLANHMYNPS